MFGPRRCRTHARTAARRRGSPFYCNNLQAHTLPGARCSPSRVAQCNGRRIASAPGLAPARNGRGLACQSPHDAYASMSRLHQGCVLLSGFAPAQKKGASLRDPLHHASRAKAARNSSCATALYDLSSIFWRETVRSCSIAANKSLLHCNIFSYDVCARDTSDISYYTIIHR